MAKEQRNEGPERPTTGSGSSEREPTPNTIREFYTVSQLADLLQLTEMTIYRLINRGELPCYAIGRLKRFRRGDVEDFLQNCRVLGTGKQPGTC
jgi:excisionase family DNA binding protein